MENQSQDNYWLLAARFQLVVRVRMHMTRMVLGQIIAMRPWIIASIFRIEPDHSDWMRCNTADGCVSSPTIVASAGVKNKRMNDKPARAVMNEVLGCRRIISVTKKAVASTANNIP